MSGGGGVRCLVLGVGVEGEVEDKVGGWVERRFLSSIREGGNLRGGREEGRRERRVWKGKVGGVRK